MSRWAKLNLLLMIVVLASAVFLVRTQYNARQAFMALEKATQQARTLDSEHETLEVEKRDAASNSKVENLASSRLGMHTSPAGSIRYARLPHEGAATP